MAQKSTTKRFHIRIELKHTEPLIWRECIVPADISLGYLHEVIQATMGWDNDHPHEFEHNRARYGPQYDDDFGESAIDEDTIPLDALFKRKGSRLTYTYDFGDNWEHEVSLVKTLSLSAKAAAEAQPFTYVGGDGTCPPEDCGGPWRFQGLQELLQKYKAKGRDALDRDQLDYLEWVEDFDQNLSPTHARSVNRQLNKIREWQAVPAEDPLQETSDFGSDEYEDFKAVMSELTQQLAETFEQDAKLYEDDSEPLPEPYSRLSADESGEYLRSLKLAAQITNAAPWNHIGAFDIFGIEDPDTGALDIVSVLGKGEQSFALQVHRAPYALSFWKTALADATLLTEDFALQNSYVIEAEFVTKDLMKAHDLALYTNTAFDAPKQGAGEWIRLRSYAPRILPNFGHLRDLPALNRGLRLCDRFLTWLETQGGVEHLPDPITTGLPVFRLEGDQPSNPAHWTLSLIPIDWDSCEPPSKVYEPSEFERARLVQLPKNEVTWEAGSIFMTTPVETEDGATVCVLSGVASHAPDAAAPVPHLDCEAEHKPAQALWNCFTETAEREGCLPSELHVTSDHAFATFAPLAKKAGFRLKQMKKNDLVQPFLEMIDMLPPPSP